MATKTSIADIGQRDTLDVAALQRYQRAVNYLAAAQIYLRDNPLLEEPLKPEHVKERLLGHWGTAPGINLVYTHLNRLIRLTDAEILLVTGPGHGAAANLANLYLEGTLAEAFPNRGYDHTKDGLRRFIRDFSWPHRLASHLTPAIPGTIHEGGELGYALGTSFGAALDNPSLIVACIVGDGEAETGPTAGAWHLNKFLDPVTGGAVLPILHVNGYKIASPTISATMSDAELTDLYTGYGWDPRIVTGSTSPELDRDMAATMDWAYARIREIQKEARDAVNGKHREAPTVPARWPMIILKTPKGMTGIDELDGVPITGTQRSHQVPGKDLKHNPEHLKAVERWLRSYKPEELFDDAGRPAADILATCPKGPFRLGASRYANGGQLRKNPPLPPNWKDFGIDVPEPDAVRASSLELAGEYLRDTMARAVDTRDFRIFSPDELESNKLGAVLKATKRAYTWPIQEEATDISPDGLVIEILSEHNCQAMLQGYLLTGRHGLFPCYEAFVAIVDSMVNQHAKFLKVMAEVPWRRPISSLNYILTSESWRQDHNGYSHQGPGFINHLISKKASMVRVYLPPDANTMLQTLDHCLWGTGRINLIIAAKQPMPQWLDTDAAEAHAVRGASVWEWASTDGGKRPDVVLAAAGDNPTLELMAAARFLLDEVPELRIRVVNITDLMVLGTATEHPHGLSQEAFVELFTADRPVIFNFHGYQGAIRQLLFDRPRSSRFQISGYMEEGTTTTPFDMHVQNGTSRWHIVQRAVRASDHLPASRVGAIAMEMDRRLTEHRHYIDQYGTDPDEIANWSWRR